MRDATMNAEKMGISNRKAVFQLIRNAPDISRKRLSESTGLDPSTISRIVSSFRRQGYVKEAGVNRSESPGRSSIRLSVVKEAAVSYLISLGVEKTILGLGFLDHTIEKIAEFSTPQNFNAFLRILAEKIESHYQKYPAKSRIIALSFSLPGIIDRKNRYIYNLPHLGWTGINLREAVETSLDKMKVEILTANEAQLSLMAERYQNETMAPYKNGFYLFLSQGIGGAILSEGELYMGRSFSAGEAGHMRIDKNGVVCQCGGRGCLETLAAIEPVVKDYERKGSVLTGANTIEKFRTLITRYNQNEPLAVDELSAMQEYMVIGITNIANLLNPEFLMIGGMGYDLPEEWTTILENRVKKEALTSAGNQFKILRATMDIHDSTLLGSDLLAMDYFTEKNIR